ncbi:hypothetical protein MTO96_048824 [Rhipicephalus appendiculatus]
MFVALKDEDSLCYGSVEAATLSSELIAACSLERSGHQFVAAGNVSRRSQREKRRDAGLELQGKTGLFPLRASDESSPRRGREGGTPAFFYKKEEKGGPPSEQTQHAAGANSRSRPQPRCSPNMEEEALAPRVGELSTAGCRRDRKECGGAEQLPLHTHTTV